MNALERLRVRLGFERSAVAQALGIPVADVETIEATPLRLLELDTVDRYVGTLGCRLDVVAVHVDGDAVWLSDEESPAIEEQPTCPECGATMARFSDNGERGWTCVHCEGQS